MWNQIVSYSRQIVAQFSTEIGRLLNIKPFDYSCALIFSSLGVIYITTSLAKLDSSLLLAAHVILVAATYFLAAYLFVIREVAADIPKIGESIIPIISMITPVLIINLAPLFQAIYELPIMGTSLMILGLLISLLAFCYLGKSFGILPARRTVVTKGIYGAIRHPAYAGEIITEFGLVLTRINIMSVAILFVGTLATIFRIIIEEKKLTADDKYKEYKSKVKYRLLPFIW